MQRSGSSDIRSHIEAAWSDPQRLMGPVIGSPGYTLPRLSDLVWREFSDLTDIMEVRTGAGSGGNWLVAPPDFRWAGRSSVHLTPHAKNNVVVVGHETNMYGHYHIHGSGGLVVLGAEVRQTSSLNVWLWGHGGLVFWGKGSTANGVTINVQGEGRRVVIGDDCMFAREVNVRDSDMHGVVDMQSEEWLNPSADVLIEPHVWVAEDAWVMKGSEVGFGSVVGGKSYVTGRVPRFSSVAGIPAKVIRSGVSWSREMRPAPGLPDALRRMAGALG